MMEPSTSVACAHALVKSQISAMDLGKYGMLACLLNDALCGQVMVIFVRWVVDSLVEVTIFVIASTLYLSLYHYLPLPLSPVPWESGFHLDTSYW
jgi:hypothetical protein